MWKPVLVEGQGDKTATEDNNRPPSSNSNSSVSFFWDGGLLANTPLRQTIIAHRDYWLRVKKLEDKIPRLRYGIINLHPAKQEYLPSDYDGLLTERMTSYIMTEHYLMKMLQLLCLISRR